MRADVYLFEQNFYSSREKARRAIMENAVKINGIQIEKPSFNVDGNACVEIVKEVNPFVGRGGLKLQKAIEHFELNLKGSIAIDVGASTGGFTDCMLQNGAKFVVACDVGEGQLDASLKNDKRVLNLEKTDIRNLVSNSIKYGIDYKFDFACIDVAFISLTKVLPCIVPLLKERSVIICLIKPQFEAGLKNQGKKGVIRDIKVHKRICEDIRLFAGRLGFRSVSGEELTEKDIIESPVMGGDGNKEFLMGLLL